MRTLLLLAVFCFAAPLLSCDVERDRLMWEKAYNGELSIAHKLLLTRDGDSFNDELLNQFVMAYAYYRVGEREGMEAIFKGIDSYIEHVAVTREE